MSKWQDWPAEFTLSATPDFPNDFPNLRPILCEGEVSPATPLYNCIAWAASDSEGWWEPDPNFQYPWPEGAIRAYSQEGYISAYQAVGFEVCDDGTLEPGMEKIAIYDDRGEPTHAARQLESGNWTSKLGPFEDIEHADLECLKGPLYGNRLVYMRRQRITPVPSLP